MMGITIIMIMSIMSIMSIMTTTTIIPKRHGRVDRS
jgi:hypothetical protein